MRDPKLILKETLLARPFSAIAETEKYPLVAASDRLRKEAGSAISRATGEPVTEIRSLSLAEAILRAKTEGRPHGVPTLVGVDAYFPHRLGPTLDERLSRDEWRTISVALDAGFLDKIRLLVQRDLEPHLGGIRGLDVMQALHSSWTYFLGYTMLDDRVVTERLTPLLRLLPRAVPLGFEHEKPGVWHVLAA